jgi:hypothetical protein
MGPWPDAEMREDSQMIDVLIDGRPAQIVPTRMHEPGLYWRYMDVPRDHPEALMRTELTAAMLAEMADRGRVRRV